MYIVKRFNKMFYSKNATNIICHRQGKETIMKAIKTIIKIVCVPLMLIVKAIVGVFGLLVLLLTLISYITTGAIGYIVSIASGLLTAITLFGIGLTIYRGEYHNLLALFIILTGSAIVSILPFVAESMLEKIGEFGSTIISLAVSDIPIVINI